MLVKKIYPRILKDEIAYIYLFKDDGSKRAGGHMHLPDGSFDLMIHWNQPLLQKEQQNSVFRPLPHVRIAGGHTKAFQISYPVGFSIYAVVFKPAYVTHFMAQLKDIAIDKNVSADEIYGSEIYDLAEQVSIAKQPEHAALLIESFLWKKRVERRHFYRPHIHRAIQLMQMQSNNVAGLCREVGMSERNFRRVFRDLTGFSPQKMLQLKRVRSLSRMLSQNRPNAQMMQTLGYYDLPHMIGDFKSVAQKTPQQYVNSLNSIDSAFHEVNSTAPSR